MIPITRNTLFYGDNLPILRDYIDTESVDLIYLDPPFNSNRSYNVSRLQVLTVAELLAGAQVQMPPAAVTFKVAERVKGETAVQTRFGLGAM